MSTIGYNRIGKEVPQMGCELNDYKGLVVQLLLAGISCLALICRLSNPIISVKRYSEKPMRTWLIWFLDVNKQGVAMVVGHCVNIYLSQILSK